MLRTRRRARGPDGGRRRLGTSPATRFGASVWIAALAATGGGGTAHAAQDVVVSPEGPVRSLAEAVRQVPTGGRIIVEPGTYREPTIVVDRPVEIVGRDFPVLDGEDQRQILTITGPDVRVTGFVLRNVPLSYIEERAGIEAVGASNCVIEGNRFENNYFGVYLREVDGCRVTGNVIEGQARLETMAGDGIHLWNSRNVVIDRNQVRGHRDGIYLEFVRNAVIDGNAVEDNIRYGLHFMFSDFCRYSGNLFRNNGAGVAVMYTARVEMAGNRFEDNWGPASYGLLLKDMRDSRMYDNVFRNNTVALFMDGSTRTRVESNRFIGNGWAVRIFANSIDNLLTRNDFVANTFDVSTNSRQNFSTFHENYWDRYDGYDLTEDGFGDVPFYPVRFFSLLVERNRPLLILLRSPFVALLDTAESVLPVLTPRTLVDQRPAMRPYR